MAFGKISRELSRDNQFFFNTILGLLCLFLGIWSLWFFKMHVNVYLDSESAVVGESSKIEAFYPLEYFTRFKKGQTGNFYLDKHRWPEYQPLPVAVENISVEATERKVRVYLAITDRSEYPGFLQGMKGRVVLLTDMKRPFELFLNQLGRKLPGMNGDAGDSENL